MESPNDTLKPETESALKELLRKVELLLLCPSLPAEVKDTLRQHEYVVRARQIVRAEVRQ